MAFGRGQVDQTTFAGHVDAAAVFQRVLVQELAHARDLGRHLLERLQLISTSKWPLLAMMAPSRMTSKWWPSTTWMSPVALQKM